MKSGLVSGRLRIFGRHTFSYAARISLFHSLAPRIGLPTFLPMPNFFGFKARIYGHAIRVGQFYVMAKPSDCRAT